MAAPALSCPRPHKALLVEAGVLLLLVTFLAQNHVAFVQANRAPPGNVDVSQHFDLSLDVYESLKASGSPGQALRVLYDRGTTYYPPLPHIVAATFHGMLGPSLRAAEHSQVVFLVILVLSSWSLGRRLWGPAGGLLGAFLAGTAPVVGGGRLFLADPPMAAMVMLHLSLLHAGDRFRRLGMAVAIGLSLGLGMLTKQMFWIYVWPAWLLFTPRRGDRRAWMHFGAALALACLVAGPWYARYGPQMLEHTRTYVWLEQGGDNATRWGHPVLLGHTVNLPAFLLAMSHALILLPVFLAFLVQCGLAPWRKDLRPAWPLLLCIAAAALFWTFSPIYRLRYMAPLGPMVGVAVGWVATLRWTVAVPVSALLVVAGFVQTIGWTPAFRHALEGRVWEKSFYHHGDWLLEEEIGKPFLFPIGVPWEGPEDEAAAALALLGDRPALLVTDEDGFGAFHFAVRQNRLEDRAHLLVLDDRGRARFPLHLRRPGGVPAEGWSVRPTSTLDELVGELVRQGVHPPREGLEFDRGDPASIRAVVVSDEHLRQAMAGQLPGWPDPVRLEGARQVGTFHGPSRRDGHSRMHILLLPERPGRT